MSRGIHAGNMAQGTSVPTHAARGRLQRRGLGSSCSCDGFGSVSGLAGGKQL